MDGGPVVFGRYALLRELGRGGMADVWLAEERSTGQQLALKRLRVDAGQTSRGTRLALFEREYYTLAQLRHARIVRVHDYGVESGDAFYTMELLPGGDLRERGVLPWRELCSVLCDVASALSLIHSRRLVHRDVTPRNVRFGADGAVRLIDFGALSPMGTCRDVVGTPPFMPPEAVNGQPLDARSDLFALGAVAYLMLSGRHAYPARGIHELHDRWRSRPTDLAALSPETPKELCALVMSLLALDPAARPASAGEIIERLAGIAGLSRSGEIAVDRAVLTTPKLVGREEQLAMVRTLVMQARRGRGAALLIGGEPGIGRTRFLERCALEGKLAGALVLQAFATDAERGEYGVLQALGEDLLRVAPELAVQAARPHAELLGSALPELARQLELVATDAQRKRRQQVQSALLAWLCAIAEQRHLVIAVDDLHRCDEPSCAVLAALSRKTETLALNLMATLPAGAEVNAPLAVQWLAASATRIGLAPLSREEFVALLSSVFGEGSRVTALAEHVHASFGGMPASAMAVAQHLVDRGFAEYERAGWVLTPNLAAIELPSGVHALHEQRLDALDGDARELGEALALASSVLPLESYARLTSHDDPERLHAAIGALVAAGILVRQGRGYGFADAAMAATLRDRVAPECRRQAHLRLFGIAEQMGADGWQLSYHLLEAGELERATETAVRWPSRALDVASEPVWFPELGAMLAALVQYAERTQRSAKDVFLLRGSLMIVSMWSDPKYALEQGRMLNERLRHDVGLIYWDEVAGETTLDKVTACLQRAQAVYDGTPEAHRGLEPMAALQELGRYVLYAAQCATAGRDVSLLRDLNEMSAPLAALAPVLELIHDVVRVAYLGFAGRITSDDAAKVLHGALQRLAHPVAGLPENHRPLFRLSVLYGLGLLHCPVQHAQVLGWADELETHELQQLNSWRLRKSFYLHQPDMRAVRRCQDQIDLLTLQLNHRPLASWAINELWFATVYRDVLTLKHTLALVTSGAVHDPSLHGYVEFGRGLQALLRADAEAAERALASAGEIIERENDPLQNGIIAYFQVLALIELEELARARVLIERWSEPMPADFRFGIYPAALALVEALEGQREAALARAAAAVRAIHAQGMYGPSRITTLECAARAALAARDAGAFERYAGEIAERCADQRCPTLRAHYATLIKQARRAALLPPDSLPPPSPGPARTDGERPSEQKRQLRAAFAGCKDQVERAECALRVLLSVARASAGFLYGLGPPLELGLLAATTGRVPSETLEAALRSHIEECSITSDDQTVQLKAAPTDRPSGLFCDRDGGRYQFVLLRDARAGRDLPAAAAVLELEAGEPYGIAHELIESIADELLAARDWTAAALVTPRRE